MNGISTWPSCTGNMVCHITLDGSCFACPMAGKRAPELAGGKLKTILQECIAEGNPNVP